MCATYCGAHEETLFLEQLIQMLGFLPKREPKCHFSTI